MPAGIRLTAGVRESEAELIATLRALQGGGRADVARLAGAPVRIIVSSTALREQLSARLVAQLGPALVGVVVQTLPMLADMLLRRAGIALRGDQGLFAALVQREVGADQALALTLGALERGHLLAAETVSDLLSAGLSDGLAASLPAVLAGAELDDTRRVMALARVATRVEAELGGHGLARRETAIARAFEALQAAGPRLLAARAVLILGFADATGQRAALLRALLACGAALWTELPDDRLVPARRAAGCAFAERFVARLGLQPAPLAATRSVAPASASASSLGFVAASGVESEVTEVAFRLQAALRAGATPERVGVVLYDVERYCIPLRRALERRGVPYRALQLPAAVDPQHRRWGAALQLCRRAAAAPLDAWLDALASHAPGAPGPAPGTGAALLWPSVEAIEDLRLALRAAGAVGLGDVARLEPELLLAGRGELPLSVRSGLRPAAAAGHATPRWYAARRRLGGDLLRWAIDAARALVRELEAWARAPLGAHLRRTRALLGDHLGWALRAPQGAADTALSQPAAVAVLAPLEDLLPGGLELETAVYLTVLERQVAAQLLPAAASGGGVWVLDVARARSLTFDELFLLGVDRGALPRGSAEDPLLSDALRQRLQRVLAELPLKRAAQDEQRYLFAQLLTAAPRVTLCWQEVDDDGGAGAPSALVQRLREQTPAGGEAEGSALTQVPGSLARRLRPPHAGGILRPRTADELARVAALTGGGEGLAFVLGRRWLEARTPSALAAAPRLEGGAAERLSRSQLALLAARDRVSWTGRSAEASGAPGATAAFGGPYAGLIGALRAGVSDPREGPLAVTLLEDLARCPWQALLRRVLHLEAARDPQGELPELSAAILGSAAHRALDLLVGAGEGPRCGAVAGAVASAAGRRVPWPSARARQAAVERAVDEVASEGGFALLPGLKRALARRVRPLVERAVALDWGAAEGAAEAEAQGPSAVHVVGAEYAGTVLLRDQQGQERVVTFRADRVDRRASALVLTDFKTGRPLSPAKRAETRLAHLRSAVRRGERLQAAVYAQFRGAPGGAPGGSPIGELRTIGRYVFLGDDDPAQQRWSADEPAAALSAATAFALADDDPAVTDDLPRVARTLFAAWDAGLFLPRLALPGEKPQRLCNRCELRAACVQGDSGARERQRRWLAALVRERGGQARGGQAGGGQPGGGESVLALWNLPAAGGAAEPSR
ncbi:MAG: PD-(D/E)XK nuclease family protein [Proteobacteria bacterium]|nr:PD-(D/E)XK nuclease family protein [Pseudomonadota bacterium]